MYDIVLSIAGDSRRSEETKMVDVAAVVQRCATTADNLIQKLIIQLSVATSDRDRVYSLMDQLKPITAHLSALQSLCEQPTLPLKELEDLKTNFGSIYVWITSGTEFIQSETTLLCSQIKKLESLLISNRAPFYSTTSSTAPKINLKQIQLSPLFQPFQQTLSAIESRSRKFGIDCYFSCARAVTNQDNNLARQVVNDLRKAGIRVMFHEDFTPIEQFYKSEVCSRISNPDWYVVVFGTKKFCEEATSSNKSDQKIEHGLISNRWQLDPSKVVRIIGEETLASDFPSDIGTGMEFFADMTNGSLYCVELLEVLERLLQASYEYDPFLQQAMKGAKVMFANCFCTSVHEVGERALDTKEIDPNIFDGLVGLISDARSEELYHVVKNLSRGF